MKNPNYIPVNTPLLEGRELELVTECITTGWISSEGPFVEEFEIKIAKRLNRKHGIAVSSGTAALDISIAALRIREGDEVILPAHTIISCAIAVVRAGAIPVLVDSDITTWNMDVRKIEEKITSKTKAIMAVHLYGLPVDIDPILDLAKKYGLYVIEDAAEMIGQDYKGESCGSFGDISILSFYPNKHITTGEGGMCLTNDSELAERCRSFRNLCFQKEKRFVHEEMGWNYRMTNLQAALGIAQLEQLEKHILKKRYIGQKYQDLLQNMTNIVLPVPTMPYGDNIYWVFGMVLREGGKINAEKTIMQLAGMGIGCRPFFWPIHLQPVFNKLGLFLNESYHIAELLGNLGFYVPSGLGLTDKQIENVAETLHKVVE